MTVYVFLKRLILLTFSEIGGLISHWPYGEYTICTQHYIRPVIWPGAIWTTRGEGRFTGVIIPPLLKKNILSY
jgi:hypothetical protein